MSRDPKRGEREYFAHIGEAGIAHSLGKPFSDEDCPMQRRPVATAATKRALQNPRGNFCLIARCVCKMIPLLTERATEIVVALRVSAGSLGQEQL